MDFGNGFTISDRGTPVFSGTIGLRKDLDFRGMPASFDLYATGETGTKPRDNSGAVTAGAGAWTTINLRGPLEVNEHASVTVQLNNLVNKSYQPYGQIPGAGRSVDRVLTARF